jgi:hypothetical protein
MIQLALYDELSEHQKSVLELHLNICKECRLEMERLRRFHNLLGHYHPAPVSEEQILDARRSLRLSLEVLPRSSPAERAREWIMAFRFPRCAETANRT